MSIISEKRAQAAWDTLRTYARMTDERWDDDAMCSIKGRVYGDIRDAFHAASRMTHPDAGGDSAAFAAVNSAKKLLLEWLEKPRPAPGRDHGDTCQTCAGKGHVMRQRGFKQLRMQCPSCKGTGEQGVEHDEGEVN